MLHRLAPFKSYTSEVSGDLIRKQLRPRCSTLISIFGWSSGRTLTSADDPTSLRRFAYFPPQIRVKSVLSGI